MTKPLATILCDLDGTLYTGKTTFPGAAEAVAELRRLGCVLRFFTNTDSKNESRLLSELNDRGLSLSADELFTPVRAAVRLLEAEHDGRVLALVSPDLASTFEPFESNSGAAISHVIVGDTRETLDYALLDQAFQSIRGGAELIALQRGKYFKDESGDHIDSGAVVAALEYSTGVRARVVGKPSQDFLRLAAASAGKVATDVWVVGDDATTDIAMGNKAGSVTVQVETGKFADQANERLAHPATHQIASFADLPGLTTSYGRAA
jgi:HAD superfamily hydrolase (TIGR01458 family)